MKLDQEIAKVWQKHQTKSELPKFIQTRKYCFCENNQQKDVLVLGINPVFGKASKAVAVKYKIEDMMQYIVKHNVHQHFFSRVQKMLNNSNSDNLLNQTAYADLFYYRTNARQRYLNHFLDHIDGIIFMQDQLKISQQLIENVIKPKVIIASSWEVMLFLGLFGLETPFCWLGYDLELIKHTKSGYRVYEIKGILDDYALADEFVKKTNLIGTRVICYPDLSKNKTQPQEHKLSTREIYNEANKVLLAKVTRIIKGK